MMFILVSDVADPGVRVRARLARRVVGGVAAGGARGRLPAPPGRAARRRRARHAPTDHARALAAQVRIP